MIQICPMLRQRLVIIWVLAFFGMVPAEAHQGHKHPDKMIGKLATLSGNENTKAEPINREEAQLAEITRAYQLQIGRLFQRACADCHSGDTRYPWYFAVPGIRQWIKQDIEEAREHMEISNGFPFQSHATPIEDLAAVEKTVQDGIMPPFSYRLMHAGARLTQAEKQLIMEWARQGQQLLRQESTSFAKP